MPTAPPTRCHCGHPATPGTTTCPTHKPTWTTPSTNTTTLTGRQRATIRDQQLTREPQCRQCGATTNLEADHIIPTSQHGALTDPANLQTLCHTCHLPKTLSEAAQGRRRRRLRG